VSAMTTYASTKDDFGMLANRIQRANAPAAELVRHVMTNSGTRFAVLQKAGKTTHIERLIEAEAWCDAALALVATELPGWSLRRLVCENGEWFCSLTQQPNISTELDDTADGRHDVLALAILGAFLEARKRMHSVRPPPGRAVPRIEPLPGFALCCDNFA